MGILVSDVDLALILIIFLSDFWDLFIMSFFGSSYATAMMTISLSALITTLCEEDEWCQTKANVMESAQWAFGKNSCPNPICTNCKDWDTPWITTMQRAAARRVKPPGKRKRKPARTVRKWTVWMSHLNYLTSCMFLHPDQVSSPVPQQTSGLMGRLKLRGL